MKSIAYIIPCFPVLSETFVGTEMRAMARQGHQITPIAFRRHHGLAQAIDIEYSNIVIYLEEIGWGKAINAIKYLNVCSSINGIAFALRQKELPVKSLIYNALKIAAIAGVRRCTHIHAHFAQGTAASAIVAARLINAKVSFVGHGHDVYESPADLKLKLDEVDRAIAPCQDMCRDFKQISNNSVIDLVYCGVDVDLFIPRKNAGHSNGKFLFVGRLDKIKGVDDIISSVALIPASQRPYIDLVGEGQLRKELEMNVKQLNLHPWIKFLDARTKEWICQFGPQYMAFIAPFKLDKSGARDSGPVVIKEAMAMGLPVITTEFMGCKEMVTEECGFKVIPNQPKLLANAISKMMSMSPEELYQMGMAGRERCVNLFSDDHQAQRLSRIIESL